MRVLIRIEAWLELAEPSFYDGATLSQAIATETEMINVLHENLGNLDFQLEVERPDAREAEAEGWPAEPVEG